MPEARYEGRRHARPLGEPFAELLRQKLLLGDHDPLVVEAEEERDHDDREDVVAVEGNRHPDQRIAEIERVAHDGVEPGRIQVLGDLPLGVAARGARRRVADRIGADCKSKRHHRKTGRLEDMVERLAAARKREIPDRENDQRREDERDVAAPAEEPVSVACELLVENHRFLRSATNFNVLRP